MTSPPYWALRDYGTKGQLGLESDFREYVSKLLGVFDELKRVLKRTGSFYLNLGDTYSRGGAIQAKCMIGIPWRVALALIDRGWILRNAICWYRANSMPASVKDRLSNTYEHIFHFVKSKKYYYNLDAIRVPHKFAAKPFNIRVRDAQKGRLQSKWGILSMAIAHGGHTGKTVRHDHPLGKNPGDLWTINSKQHPFAHFAVYPEEICVGPILSSCPEQVCVKCGTPRFSNDCCECNDGFHPGIVLDMFAGSGTTPVVARKLGRDYVGIELNPEYVKIAKQRLASVSRPIAASLV
jgi:site-specific DNA-methyltransferase (adenine-specific)